MDRFARALMFVLLLAVAGLSAGCGSTGEGTFDWDEFWKELDRNQPGT
jgi:hypothetical protein